MALNTKYIDTLKDAFSKLDNIDTLENFNSNVGEKFAYFGRRQFGGVKNIPGTNYKENYELINCFCVGVTVPKCESIIGYRSEPSKTAFGGYAQIPKYGLKVFDPVKDKHIYLPGTTIVYTFKDPLIYDSLEFIGAVDNLTSSLV